MNTIRIITMTVMLMLPVGAALGISLEEAERLALERSASYKALLNEAQAVRAEGREAISFILPQVSVEAGYYELGTNAPDIPVPGLGYPEKEHSAGITATQVIFTGGRAVNSMGLRRSLDAGAVLMEQAARRDLLRDVKRAYYHSLYRKAVAQIALDRVLQMEAERADAIEMLAAGVVTQLDVRQAELSLNLAESERRAVEAAYSLALIDLGVLIGGDGLEHPEVPDGRLEGPSSLRPRLDALSRRHEKGDLLDLRRKANEAEAAEFLYNIERGAGFPQLAVVYGAEAVGERYDETSESWTLGLALTWDIYDGGLVRARSEARASEASAALWQKEALERSMGGVVRGLGERVVSLEHRIELGRESARLADENYQDARGHYRAGAITITDLGQFNLRFAEARFQLLALFYEGHLLQIEIETLLQ